MSLFLHFIKLLVFFKQYEVHVFTSLSVVSLGLFPFVYLFVFFYLQIMIKVMFIRSSYFCLIHVHRYCSDMPTSIVSWEQCTWINEFSKNTICYAICLLHVHTLKRGIACIHLIILHYGIFCNCIFCNGM